jgi:TolB-like protein
MPESKAVFLSYASEDGAAAQRIADVLRDAGVTVWFDRSELRGGDAWDASIRQQIRDCALFVPIISTNTQAREEGYFRREWHLAADRTLDMGEHKAFLLPVVLDDTPQKAANVPARFRDVQWVRIPDGQVPSGFVTRIQQLSGMGPQTWTESRPANAGPMGGTSNSRHGPARVVTLLAVAVLVIAVCAWYVVHGRKAGIELGSPASDKSIAVLPFTDMSEKHDQEYFADGLSEELIDRLAHLRDIMVVARTSSFAFKGKSDDMRAIAAKLGVAYLLEGSVRRSGKTLRVTAQLIRAADGRHVWSQSFDRDQTDALRVQNEIARAIALYLNATLTEGLPVASEDTQNVEALDLFLKARSVLRHINSANEQRRAIALLRKVVALDPKFASAWADLSSQVMDEPQDPTLQDPAQISRRYDAVLAEARSMAQRAIDANPRLADAHAALARVFIAGYVDVIKAEAQVNEALSLDPRNTWAMAWQAMISAYRKDFPKARTLIGLAIRQDPLNPSRPLDEGEIEYLARDYAASSVALDRLPEFVKSDYNKYLHARVLFAQGRAADALDVMARVEDPDIQKYCGWCVLALESLGRKAEAEKRFAALQERDGIGNEYEIGRVYAGRGNLDIAFRWFDRALQRHDFGLTELAADPLLNSDLRKDPRYHDLARRIGLEAGS